MSARTAATLALLLCVGVAAAQDKARQDAPKKAEDETKEVSGMSIVGNSETPKSLTIIPWKASQLGRDTEFSSSLLGQDLTPLDKPTFLRGIDFYKLSNRNQVSVKEF